MTLVRRHAVVIVLAVALAARLAVIVATPGFEPTGDPADYERHAVWIAATGGYPPTLLAEPGGATALRPPAYPYLLAGAYGLPGDGRVAGRVLGALLGMLSVALLMALAGRLLGPRESRWAGAGAAVFPPLVWLNGSLVSESLFNPLVLGALLCALRGGARWAAAAGALCGLAMLTRSNGAVLLVCILAGLAVSTRGARAPALALAAALLVLVPWTARNEAAFGRLLPLGTQSGYTLAGQYNEVAAAPGGLQAAWRIGQEVPALAGLFRRPGIDEAELDAELRSRALDFARDRPRHVLAALRLNVVRLFELGPGHRFTSDVSLGEMGVPASQRAGLRLSLYVALVLAAFGAVVLIRRRAGPWWVWLAPILLLASVAPLLGAPRYRAPIDPFLLLAAAAAIAAWRGRERLPAGARAGRNA